WREAADRWAPPLLRDKRSAAIVAELREEPKRTNALRRIAEASLTEQQGRHLIAWYETVYADFVARNNGADWIDMTGGRFSDTPVTRSAGVRARMITLRGAAPIHLGTMPRSQYELLCYRARDAIALWQSEPTPRSADRIAYAIERAQSQDDLDNDRRDLAVGLAATLIVTTLLLGLEAMAGSLPIGIWFVPVVTLALTMALELRSARAPIRAVRRSELRSTIHLTTGGG
ncbi:hypothetical protein, partial [Nostocoides australiense]|nr:hypothetical protein [Tetrasphaera australiensis]